MALIATWHPTYAFFHNPYEWGAFQGDLDRFARLLKGTLEAPPRFIITKPKAKHIRALRKKYSTVAVDIETGPAPLMGSHTGKDPTLARLKTIGIGAPDGGISYWVGTDKKVEREIARLLADPAIIKVFHNGHWFDLRVLARYGFKCAGVHDTRDARRALSSTSPLRLSYLASLYTDAHPWKEDEDDSEKGLVFTDSRKKLKVYNAYDCVYTARVWRGVEAEPEWNTPRVQRLYQVHTDLARIAAEMHTHGFKVDKTRRQFMAWALDEEFREKEERLKKAVGIDGFECNPYHLRALIFERHAVGKYARFARFNLPDPFDPNMWTDKDRMDTISVDEDTLILLLIDPSTPDDLKHLIQLYWDAQSVRKQRSTFVVSELIDQAIGPDGRLRPGWNSCGTDTGRFSCSKPNLMNIEQLLRGMYVADKGCLIIGSDWSQLELRVMRAVAKDRMLGAALDTGDVYSVDAKEWFGLPADMNVKKLKPGARKAAKIIHLGSQYAAGTKTVYQQALKQDRSMSWELVNGLHRGFKRTYCDTVRYWDEEMGRVMKTAYSESRILNRRRAYPQPPPITEVANYPVQSTASDIANLSMIVMDAKLKKYFPKAKLIVQLHDAFYVEAPKKQAAAVKDLMVECMDVEHVIDGDTYRFPVEAKIADNWADL